MAKLPVLFLITVSLAAVLGQLGPDSPGVEGLIRLIGGKARGTGTVVVYHNRKWGKVCDDGWNLEAASIVCKSLGFARALMASTQSHFGGDFTDYVNSPYTTQFSLTSRQCRKHVNYIHVDFWLDDVRCAGSEMRLTECEHAPWGVHNCHDNENAGVYCIPFSMESLALQTIPPEPERTKPNSDLSASSTPGPKGQVKDSQNNNSPNDEVIPKQEKVRRKFPNVYPVRLANGRTPNEGIVEVEIDGKWGIICGDDWSLLEGMAACKQAGLGYAKQAFGVSLFGNSDKDKVLSGVQCEWNDETLSECHHGSLEGGVSCSSPEKIASVICTDALPDLVPNATLVQESSYLQDLPMYYIQCAMEENCAAKSAFTIRETYPDWHLHRRRLLRFSTSTWNFGTAEFRPKARKEEWEWHLCHMHYHSMHVFASYDLVDEHHNRVAQGHKASFCLEDVQCKPGVEKKFHCTGFGDQGISIGCADDYLHDIDCQWIDITDVPPGKYLFKDVTEQPHLKHDVKSVFDY
ncbi:hypothetical protein LSH36_91g05015 [Paralvinella palmiformis]|uniref:SRCR domain-containing protein n=1 Tax=Paralvinella palmiformis TaxID=53620 RepID=A0AAD9K0H0_9ANNE|nr:hypothetical protein LSH36_91g05015 [Paralvinella palmiformis]